MVLVVLPELAQLVEYPSVMIVLQLQLELTIKLLK
jgi:hypothetical protein